jgi:hypothetical protein
MKNLEDKAIAQAVLRANAYNQRNLLETSYVIKGLYTINDLMFKHEEIDETEKFEDATKLLEEHRSSFGEGWFIYIEKRYR